MSAQIDVTAHVDPQQLAAATAVYAEAGMTLADAFRLLIVKTAESHAVPFDTFHPNQETVDAMLEARSGKLQRFATVNSLLADLNAGH